MCEGILILVHISQYYIPYLLDVVTCLNHSMNESPSDHVFTHECTIHHAVWLGVV